MKKIMTKIVGAFLGVAMTIGVGAVLAQNANAVYAATDTTQYELVNNVNDLEAGKSYVITSGSSGSCYAMSKASQANYRELTSINVYDNKFTANENVLRLTLGGSTGAWTFLTENYAGTAGYLASAASGNNNYCRVIADAPSGTISFSGNQAVINVGPHSSRTQIRYNSGSTRFACYSSGQAAIYLFKEVESGGSQDPVELNNPAPQYDDLDKIVSWTGDTNATKYQVKVDNGSYADIETSTYDARGLSVGDKHTVYIKAVGDGTNYLDSEASVEFTPTPYEVHRKFVVKTKTSVTETGDAITGATTTFSQTANNLYQITNGNSMTLSLTGLTKKVTINKLVLSMHSNKKSGSGSVYIKTDNSAASYIAGTADSGVTFEHMGDNAAFSETEYVDVNWTSLNYIAKSSIEIKISGTDNSLYCQSFLIFFSEQENNDYVSELTVSPNTWTGYDTSLLQIEDFTVSVTTGGVAGSAVDYTFLGIGYMDGDNFVARDANFIYGYPQVADTRLAWKANYPTTAGGDTYLYAYVTLNVSTDTIASVAISGNMTKTTYFTNDNWMYYGLTAEAVYASGNRINVTGFATYQYYSDSAMTNEVATPADLGPGENQKLYVKATYEGISNTVGYEQTVSLSIEHGSLITDPLTADEAITMGKDLQYATEKEYYIRGIISEIDTSSDHTNETCATFLLANSDDTYDFEAFKVKYDANCTNHEDLQVGAEVLIKCQLRRVTIDGKHLVENGSDNGVLLSISFTKPALESVKLNKTKLYLAVNDTYNLKASAYPLGADLDTVVWSTLNNSVATVDQNGVVTAVGLGSATITATSGEITSTCNVVVSEKAVMRYSGSKTGNMTATGNAATVGLDASIFSVDSDKGDNSNFAGLNQDGTIRLYKSNGAGGTSFTVSIDSAYAIEAVVISYKSGAENASVYAGSRTVAGNDGLYVINNKSFKVQNTGSPDQVQIESIGIFYRDANAQDKVEQLDTQTSLAYRYEKDGEGNFSYSDIVMRFGANISKDTWNELEGITGFGVILMDGGLVTTTDEMDYAIANDMVSSAVTENLGEHMAIDYFVPVADMNETIGETENSYFWNLRVSVNEADIDKYFTAVAYIKVGDEYVFLNMARESVSSVAKDYLDNRGCTAETAGGSLANLAA